MTQRWPQKGLSGMGSSNMFCFPKKKRKKKKIKFCFKTEPCLFKLMLKSFIKIDQVEIIRKHNSNW